jgi:2-methylfumaryl-CoA hydratase
MTIINLIDLKEISGQIPVDLTQKKNPSYGRVLEDFQEGDVFVHPRGLTITESFALDFATTFHEANPLYLNGEFAKAHGFCDLLVSPLLTMNVGLSLGVQNDSEKAVANLGYYNVKFCAPVYPNDTLRAYTQVLQVKSRGEDKPGIVTIRTLAVNQNQKTVLQYDRKIMVAPAGGKTLATTQVQKEWPGQEMGALCLTPKIVLPEIKKYPRDLTGLHTYFENFAVGDIIVHPNGRTVTDEHFAWTYRVMNTHPLHYDKLYSSGRSGKMSGDPIVYGGLAFAWLCGLASRDVSENALWDLGYTEGYHTQPLISGETIYALSRVLAKENTSAQAGIVTFQLIGVKGMKGSAALEKYGADLFIKENGKKELGKEKIPEKIFEIERRLLIKK